MTERSVAHPLFAFALLCASCGGTSTATVARDASADPSQASSSDAAPPADGGDPPGDGAPRGDASDEATPLDAGALVLPQVLTFDGGILATPTLVAVTFPGDTEAAQIGAFTAAVGASAYWSAVTSEYGVGPATGRTILETEAAPPTVNQANGDSEAWLATRFDGTHPDWGVFDPRAVYLVFYPSTTTATPSVGGCGGAYHDAIPIALPPSVDGGASGSGKLVYGVVFRCATSPDVGRPTGFDLTTLMASHEMVEAVTDPFGTAFAQTDDDHVAWAYFFGSEIGDMCAFNAGSAIKPADLGYTVQRTWSNAAAAASLDPCVPGGTAPLFLAAPLGESSISLPNGAGKSFGSEGFTLHTGQSLTIDVAFYGVAGALRQERRHRAAHAHARRRGQRFVRGGRGEARLRDGNRDERVVLRGHELMQMSPESPWQPRPTCPRCRRPTSVCYCAHLTSLETSTRVLILQHPRERDMAIGTARMASLCLPNAELAVGIRWDDSPILARALSDPDRPAVLLYPGEGAIDVAAHPPPGPVTLIVIDGTWSQAKTLVRDNPRLHALPRYTFQPAAPSEYRIRKEPNELYVSTIEALVFVLGALEKDPARFHALLAPFRAMIDAQLDCERRFHGGRTRHPKKKRPSPNVPRAFRERFGDIVCVVGEANAWPYCSRERGVLYEDELVHWTSCRVATGETLDFVVAPRNPLAPRTPSYVALPRERLAAGGTMADLALRWRGFVRETDIVCFWGHYGAALFASSGGHLPSARIDLRPVARAYAKRKVGTLEDFLASIDPAPQTPLATGRAGARLAGLARLARHFGDVARREP